MIASSKLRSRFERKWASGQPPSIEEAPRPTDCDSENYSSWR